MLNMTKNNFFLIFFALFLSCNKSFETSKELEDYLEEEENGYRYSKSVNEVNYVLQYRPTDLLVNQEIIKDAKPEEIEKLREHYSKYLYFNLSMSIADKELLNTVAGNRSKFGAMVNDLAFGMDRKIHLLTDAKDTIEMVDFIYPRMYGMSNSTLLMIVYPREKKVLDGEYLNFIIDDLGFYTGEVKFRLNTKALKEEPRLSF